MLEFDLVIVRKELCYFFCQDVSRVIINYAEMRNMSELFLLEPFELLNWLRKQSITDQNIYLYDHFLLIHWYRHQTIGIGDYIWAKFTFHYLNIKDYENKSLLFYAIAKQDLTVVRTLLSLEVSYMQTIDDDGNLPIIFYAIKCKNIAIVESLLKYYKGEVNKKGQNLLDFAFDVNIDASFFELIVTKFKDL